MQRAFTLAVVAGVVALVAVAAAVAGGMVLSVDSAPVSLATGVFAGALVGAIALLLTADRSTPDVYRHAATGLGLFGTTALGIFLGASTAGVANTTAMAVGAVVGAVLGVGVFYRLRENASRQVTAI